MSWWERIKLFFKNKKNNVKALPEQTTTEKINVEQDSEQEWKVSQKVEKKENIPERKLDKLEESIQQYMQAYYQKWLKGNVNSYNVLTGLNTGNEPQGNNKSIQQQLISYLENNREYRTHKQFDKSRETMHFLHVYHGEYKLNEEDFVRLYINAKRENVSILAYQVIQNLRDCPYYFKLISDEAMESRSRSEKLVFYTDNMQVNRIIQALKKVKKEYPQLLEGSEIANPFMKKIEGFIGYAPQPRTEEYKNLKGETKKQAKSYNGFLAAALEESMTKAMQDIVAKDSNLTLQTRGIVGDINQYMRVYPTIVEKYKHELLSKTKQNLAILKRNNECIEIEGLGDEQSVR